MTSAAPLEYNNWWFVAVLAADGVNDLQDYAIRDMSTVPRQQKIHTVHRGDRHVERV